MPITPIGWQSQARRDALLELLSARANTAMKQWTSLESVSSTFDHAKPVASVSDYWMFEARSGGIAVMGPANSFGELGRGLLGMLWLDGFGLAEGVGERAFTDLLASMCGLKPAECVIVERHSPSPEQLDPRRGIASFHWRVAGLDLVLHFDAAMCAQVLPRQRVIATPLTNRANALMDSVVPVEAIVGLGQMDALRIADLKPGYIIKTDTRLDSPVELKFGNDASSLVGQLVALGECRAFRRGANTQGELT